MLALEGGVASQRIVDRRRGEPGITQAAQLLLAVIVLNPGWRRCAARAARHGKADAFVEGDAGRSWPGAACRELEGPEPGSSLMSARDRRREMRWVSGRLDLVVAIVAHGMLDDQHAERAPCPEHQHTPGKG